MCFYTRSFSRNSLVSPFSTVTGMVLTGFHRASSSASRCQWVFFPVWYEKWKWSNRDDTVDGRNPAPVDMVRVFPIIYRVSYNPGGAGFQPSTVSITPGQIIAGPNRTNQRVQWYLILAHLGWSPYSRSQLLWVDRGILHVGPTKSLTFSRGPKFCLVIR